MNYTLNTTATITEKRIASSKGLQLICAILAFVLDSLVIGILLVNSTEIKFLVCPCLIALLDLLFIIKVIFSNYRFSYALNGALIHALVIVLVAAFALLGTGVLEKRVIFVSFALYAMPAVHLLQSLAVLVTAFHAAKTGKTLQKITAILLTALFIGGAGVYGNFLLNDGFFGQGVKMEDLTVTYSLSDDKTSYVVTGALKGKGNTVTVPAEFNGLPVSGIDCAVFTDEKIDFVVLGCGPDIEFLNVAEMQAINPDLKVLAPKAEMDDFRAALYGLVRSNGEMLNLANIVFPSDLNASEVFVAVRYDSETLSLAGTDFIPTWFGEKGSTYDVSAYKDAVSYVGKSNKTNENDLYWSYHNMNTLIFDKVVNEIGADIDGRAISESVNATVTFEKIFRVEITEDNDERYNIDEAIRFIALDEGNYEYKLATADRVQEILSAMPARDGFNFAYYTGTDNHIFQIQLLQDELDAVLAAGGDCFTLRPVWELKAPSITGIAADGKTTGHSAVYGSNVSLTSSATAPAESLSLRYEWSFKDTVANTANHTLSNLHPTDAGVYTLTVTTYSDSITSLEKSVSATVTVGFEKKELNFLWSLPSDTIYSASNKSITATPDSGDVINNDVIEFGLSGCSTANGEFFVRDAGSYNLSAVLKGDADTKYFVATADKDRTLSITPYTLSVTWEDVNEFVYNGQNQSPNATAVGLGGDGNLTLNLTGKGLNVGTYDVTATTENTNYTLTENVKSFTITKRPVTVSTWGQNSLVYTGAAQNVKVTAVDNAVSGEQNSILDSILYSGDGTNVGSYTTTASLPADSNYFFSVTPTASFSITPKDLTIKIDDRVHTYDGLVYTSFSFQQNGLVTTDRINDVLTLSYKDEAVTAVNVRTTAYTIDADIIGGEKYQNYTVTLQTGTLKINPKNLTITINNASMVYNGNTYSAFSFQYSELAVTDIIEEILSLNYGGTAIAAINAGSNYNITGTAVAQAKYNNYTVTIKPATLTITQAPLTVTAVGGTKVYDGSVATSSSFSIIVDGLVNGETVSQLGSPRYTGAATTNKNVGEHKLEVSFAQNDVNKNYSITYVAGSYEITKCDLLVSVVSTSKVYDGKTGGSFSITASGLVTGETVANLGTPTYGGSAQSAKNVGVYELTVALAQNTYTNNYNITYIDGTYEITPKEITITATNVSKTYDGQTGGSFDFTVSGLVSGEAKTVLGTATYTGAATAGKDVGSYEYSVVVAGNDNYSITSITGGTLTINKRSLTVKPTATSKTYDGQIGGTFGYEVASGTLASGEFLDMLGTFSFTGTAVSAKDVGSYILALSFVPADAANNYNITYSSQAAFTISKKNATVTAVAPSNKEYDGTGFSSSDYGFTTDGLVAGEALTDPTYSGNILSAKNAGSYTLTVTFNSSNAVAKNYNITYVNATAEISKKTATVTAVAPSDKVYDGKAFAQSSFSFTAEGLIAGEALTGASYGGSILNGKNVGNYELTVSFDANGVAKNYNITYVSAYVNITQKALTVTAVAPSDKVYDGKTFAQSSFSFTAEGLVAGDVLTGAIYGGSILDGKNVGEYTLTVSFDASNSVAKNYNITYVSDTAEITKRALTVTATATDRAYAEGTKGGEFSITVEGLAEGDTVAALGEPIYGGSAVEAEQAGTYTLTVELPASDLLSNYEVTYVSDAEFIISAPEAATT